MYDIFIRFTDGSKIILPNVKSYTWKHDMGCLMVEINGYRQMFNLNSVMFVGCVFDLGEEVVSA